MNKGIPEDRLRGGKGEELVGILRRLGDAAGVPGVVEPTERDEEVSVYLFDGRRQPSGTRRCAGSSPTERAPANCAPWRTS